MKKILVFLVATLFSVGVAWADTTYDIEPGTMPDDEKLLQLSRLK